MCDTQLPYSCRPHDKSLSVADKSGLEPSYSFVIVPGRGVKSRDQSGVAPGPKIRWGSNLHGQNHDSIILF